MTSTRQIADFSKNEARRLYKWIDKHVIETYEKFFGLDLDDLKKVYIKEKEDNQ